jgi:hypothetical protein
MRLVMTAIFDAARVAGGARGAAPLLFLFANDTVLDFYPRFGFVRVRESIFRAGHSVRPAAGACRRLDLNVAQDRALIAHTCEYARPVSPRFSATQYYGILLWHGCHDPRLEFFYSPRHEAIVVTRSDGAQLIVADVLAAQPFALRPLLPEFVTTDVEEIEFGFTPDIWWPTAQVVGEYTESPLFVNGELNAGGQPFKFPMLAQT